MVPDNLMVRDTDSEAGYSINHDVLQQLLTKLYSSSIVKRREMVNDQAECRECCENEEEEHHVDYEENAEENIHHQADNSNNHQQHREQMTRYTYRPAFPQESDRLEDQTTQARPDIREYEDRGRETYSTLYSPKVPQAVFQQQIEQVRSNPSPSTGVEYQTVSGQFPFTEFSPRSFDQSEQRKVLSSNQNVNQYSPRGMQQRYGHQQTRPSIQSNKQTFAFSDRLLTRNFQHVQQDIAEREQPAVADYRQYGNHPADTPEQCQRQSLHPPPRLQIGNVSVHRRTPSS